MTVSSNLPNSADIAQAHKHVVLDAISELQRAAGISGRSIARELGCDHVTVCNHLLGRCKSTDWHTLALIVLSMAAQRMDRDTCAQRAKLLALLPTTRHQSPRSLPPTRMSGDDVFELFRECHEQANGRLFTFHRNFPISRFPASLRPAHIRSAVSSSPWNDEQEVATHLNQRFTSFDKKYGRYIRCNDVPQTTFMDVQHFQDLLHSLDSPDNDDRVDAFLDHIIKEEMTHRNFQICLVDTSALDESTRSELWKMDWVLCTPTICARRTRMVDVEIYTEPNGVAAQRHLVHSVARKAVHARTSRGIEDYLMYCKRLVQAKRKTKHS
ncbi:MAG: hypothetical protein ACYC6N_00980 [Pirellulaceae bacterium]